MSDRLTDRLVSPPARASARNARTREMRRDDETSTERRTAAEERARHLRRIVDSYPATISPQNAELLRKILGLDDEDTEE